MRCHVFPTEGLPFEKLSTTVKEQAINHNRQLQVEGYDWWDSSYYDFKSILKEYGLEANTFYFSIDRDCYLEAHNLCIANTAQFLEKFDLVMTEDCILSIKNTTRYELEVEILNCDWDMTKFCDLVADKIKALLNSFLIILQKEYEYLTSNQSVSEALIANNYLFNHEGNLV